MERTPRSSPRQVVPTPARPASAPPRFVAPAPGRPVTLLEGDAPPESHFVVAYEDEEYAFVEGAWGRFGRDDARCQIPIWEEVRGASLSRIAGELWCAQGDMWLRNLSTSHELTVAGSIGRPQTLPPRHASERGPACSVPGQTAVVEAPSTGEWQVRITRRATTAAAGPPSAALPVTAGAPDWDAEPHTQRMAVIPAQLMPVATELCAPMIEHGAAPATYDEIAARLDISRRQARRYVDKLCDYYSDSVPGLTDDAGLGKPHYVPVAELLVGRGRITRVDVERERRSRDRPDHADGPTR